MGQADIDIDMIRIERSMWSLLYALENSFSNSGTELPHWAKDLQKIVEKLKYWDVSRGEKPPMIEDYSSWGRAYNYVLGYDVSASWDNDTFVEAIQVLAPLALIFMDSTKKKEFVKIIFRQPWASGDAPIFNVLKASYEGKTPDTDLVLKILKEVLSSSGYGYLGYVSLIQHELAKLLRSKSSISATEKYLLSTVSARLYGAFDNVQVLIMGAPITRVGAKNTYGTLAAAIICTKLSLLGLPLSFKPDVYRLLSRESVSLRDVLWLATDSNDREDIDRLLQGDNIKNLLKDAVLMGFGAALFLLGGVGGVEDLLGIGTILSNYGISESFAFFVGCIIGFFGGVFLLAWRISQRIRKLRLILEKERITLFDK